MQQTVTQPVSLWKRLLFSEVLCTKSTAQKIAYVGVMTALCVASNLFEIKFATVQFSITVFASVIAGIMIGPLLGFCAAFLGDAIGFLQNAGFAYYWWVALSVAVMALIAGLVMNGLRFRFKGAVYVKLAIICVLTFFVCSLGINTTGMYYIGLNIYFPKNVQEAITNVFGGQFSYWIYFAVRFFLLGQIWNSVVNYALLFAVVPVLNAIKPLKLSLS